MEKIDQRSLKAIVAASEALTDEFYEIDCFEDPGDAIMQYNDLLETMTGLVKANLLKNVVADDVEVDE